MKILVLTFILIFPLSSSASCLLRISIDPSYSKTVLTSFEKIAKDKKYKIISELDERWEDFRLKISNPSIAAVENVVIKLQKFVSPNFEVAYETGLEVSSKGRDAMALSSLNDLPTCPKALYSDIFAKLED